MENHYWNIQEAGAWKWLSRPLWHTGGVRLPFEVVLGLLAVAEEPDRDLALQPLGDEHAPTLQRARVLGWPERCELACVFLWECSYKRLELAQLLGRLGVFLTCAAAALPSAARPARRASTSPGRARARPARAPAPRRAPRRAGPRGPAASPRQKQRHPICLASLV